jgi:hypothetical protein
MNVPPAGYEEKQTVRRFDASTSKIHSKRSTTLLRKHSFIGNSLITFNTLQFRNNVSRVEIRTLLTGFYRVLHGINDMKPVFFSLHGSSYLLNLSVIFHQRELLI